MPRRAEIAASLPIVFGLDRLQAAASIGVSVTTFDHMVNTSQMPRPRMINTRKVWDVDELRQAFKSLPRDGEPAGGTNSWSDF
jgi:predicted DNA-binding transcriptional regulator AlpA